MLDIEVQKKIGRDARSLVEPFYKRNGSRGTARDMDLFFIATQPGHDVLGCVRYCMEERTPLLRTMMVDEGFRHLGIGMRLLKEFEAHLERVADA